MGLLVGLIVTGFLVGLAVAGFLVGLRVGCVAVGLIVGLVVGFGVMPATVEHPAVLRTSLTTASLHAPPVSLLLTQKKAPPLHENTPLLYVLRSAVIFTACPAFAFEFPQSEMQWPNTT